MVLVVISWRDEGSNLDHDIKIKELIFSYCRICFTKAMPNLLKDGEAEKQIL